jgi:hypothetical protein
MPFFFIGFGWILCLLAGCVLLCFRRLRFLASYLLFGSTGLTLVSFLLSTAVLLAIGHFSFHLIILAIVGYFGAIVAGGFLGAAGGLIVARKINRRFRLI